MRNEDSSNKSTMGKDKIEIVYGGVNTNEMDINYIICCYGAMFVFRG